MNLAYLEKMRNVDLLERRKALKTLGASLLVAGITPAEVFAGNHQGFKGTGRMGMTSGEDWIDTFFTGGAEEIIHYYADDFVFEDITLYQTITDKESLYRAFLPFGDFGPDAPAGVHQFDVIRYDGGLAGDRKNIARSETPAGYSADEWQLWSSDALTGIEFDYDEWCVMNWVWKAKHNADEFLGLTGCKGKTTYARGITFHMYKNRKVVREFTHWNFRGVAVQLGVMPPPNKFWLPQA